jgi:type I restriction enzyme, S subunit
MQLRRATTSRCDGPFGSDMKSEHYSDAGVRLIRLQNIENGWFDDSDQVFVPDEHFKALPGHDALPGDLLIAGLGDTNHPLGRGCILPNSVRVAMVKADCFRFRLDEGILLHRFIAHFLSSQAARLVVDSEVRGATRSRINLSGVGRIPVPVPPLTEQRAIADFLDRKTAAIDALIEKKERLIQLNSEQFRALRRRATTLGIREVPTARSNVPWLGPVPAHWRVIRLGRLVRFVAGAGFPPGFQGLLDGEFPFFKVGDMASPGNEREMRVAENHVSRSTARALGAKVCPAGAVVSAKVGAALRLNRRRLLSRPSLIDNNMIAMAPTEIESSYLLHYLSEIDFGEWANPGPVPSINQGDLREIPVPVPPRDEQIAIAAHLDGISDLTRASETRCRESVERVREYRQVLITAAVTGQLDLTKEAA